MVKSTVCARSGVIDMPPMMTSNLPARRAGMMPLQAVGWKSTLTPRSSATFFATSISNPMSSPLFDRMAQGTKVALPTTSVPRFLIVSMSPSCAAAAAAAPSTNTIAESHLVIDRTTCPSPVAAGLSAAVESSFDETGSKRQTHRQSQIDPGDGKPNLEGHECVGDDILPRGGELGDGDHGQDGGVLDQGDQHAGQRRQDEADGLRDDHVPIAVETVKADCRRRLVLPAGDGQEPAANDLACEGAFKERDAQHARPKAIDADDRGDHEVEEKELHQQRGVADELEITAGERSGRERARQPHGRGADPDDQGQQAGESANLHGRPKAAHQRPPDPPAIDHTDEVARHALPLPAVLHRLGAAPDEPCDECEDERRLEEGSESAKSLAGRGSVRPDA